MSGVFDRSAAVARTRLGYFQPSRTLARTGRTEDVPQALRGRDLVVPYYVRRALELERAEGVVVHSVVLKLLLPQQVLLSIRILPEGYEVVDVRAQQVEPGDRLRQLRDQFDEFRNKNLNELRDFAEKLKAAHSGDPDFDPTQTDEY